MNGLWFNDIHSYEHLNLVLSKVSIPPATPKTSFIDIPGGDGSVDLTEAQGEVRYRDRECSFTFTVFPDENFEEKKKNISNLINGRRYRIRLDKDPLYYYEGRCVINEYASDKNHHQIVVNATVAPYKLKVNQTVVTVAPGESVTGSLTNGRKSVLPTITCTEVADIVFEGNTYNLNAGTHTLLNIMLKEGNNIVTVTSDGETTFTYQEGDL